MRLETCIRIAGVLQIALSLLHILFPARFQWREELPRLSLLNRQMFQAHYFFIALVVMMFGVLSAFFGRALLGPGALSPLVLSGLTLFWLLRLIAQFFWYSPALWRGNRLHTFVHVTFTLLWAYLTAVYGFALRSVLDA